MTKKVEDEQRIRKAYSPRGERSQRMFNFRMDIDNWEKVQKHPNKGKFVNDAIRAYE